MLKTRKI